MAFSSAALQTLGELLSGFQFHIPDYQRGYAWGKPQLEALWNDLVVAANSTATQHFTGVVLLKNIGSADDVRPSVELVDGQQRVISSMTLASALMAHHGAVSRTRPAFSIRFEDNREMQAYVDFWALGDKSQASRLQPDCSSYAANVEFAATYFAERVASLSDAQAQTYLDVLLDRFCLFILDVQPTFDIHVAFETLNNRGKKLSNLELLKNRLIYLTNVLPGASPSGDEVRQQIHMAWKGIYRSLGRSKLTQNHDDEFLRAHAIAYFGEVKDADWLAKVLFDKTFNITNAELDLEFIQVYCRHLEQAAKWWSHLHDTRYMPKSHQLRLERIARVGHAYFKPLVLAAYMRIASPRPDAIVEPAKHDRLLEPVLPLLKQVERFVVLILVLAGRPAHLGRADMNRLARALMRPDQPIEGHWMKEGLHRMSGADAMEFASSYIWAYIDNRETGGTWTDPRFEWEGLFSDQDVAQTVASRLRTGTGYYNWAFTRLVLLEYEEGRRESGNKPIALKWPWDEFSFDRTVEHIFPQNPGKSAYWNNTIPIDGRAKGLRNAVVHSLGNLMLLSTKINSSVSTLPFLAKNERCKRDEYAQGSYSETQVAHIFASRDWDIAAIAARGVAMLKFAEERWEFNLTDSPDNYVSYLPLLFGEKAEEVRKGQASNDTSVDNRALNPLVRALLA